MGFASGVQRSLRPFPRTRTWAPVPTAKSSRVAAVISESRRPVWHRGQHESVIASSDPGPLIGGAKESIDLRACQEADQRSSESFTGNGEDALDLGRVSRQLVCHVPKKEWIAVRRRLRLRTVRPRCFSR